MKLLAKERQESGKRVEDEKPATDKYNSFTETKGSYLFDRVEGQASFLYTSWVFPLVTVSEHTA